MDFASLYREHADHLHRFALYLSGDATLAEDLVSEAFVRVWTARERVELGTVRGYLFAIVSNLFLDDVRRRRGQTPLDDRLPAIQPGPDDRVRDQSRLRATLAALATLSPAERSAVLMRADGAMPYEEIAATLGMTVAAAKVKVHRARLKLAAALHETAGTESRR